MNREIDSRMEKIHTAHYVKREAAFQAEVHGTLYGKAVAAAYKAADAEAAAAKAAAVAECKAAAAVRSDEEVNRILGTQPLLGDEGAGMLFVWERLEILSAVTAMPMLRHLKWALQVSWFWILDLFICCFQNHTAEDWVCMLLHQWHSGLEQLSCIQQIMPAL
jgi:hypothetical protein